MRVAVVPAAALAYAGLVERWNPFAAHAVGCPIHGIFGVWCPGCGSTRAVFELLHGRVISSLHCNVLVLPAIALLTYWWVGSLAPQKPTWFRHPTEISARVLGVALTLVVAFAIARNTSAFAFLAPLSRA